MLGRERPCSANWALVNLNARRVRRAVPLASTPVETAAHVAIKPRVVISVPRSSAALRAADIRYCSVGGAAVRPFAAREVAAAVLIARVLKIGAVVSLVVARRQQHMRRAARRWSHAARRRASAVVIGHGVRRAAARWESAKGGAERLRGRRCKQR